MIEPALILRAAPRNPTLAVARRGAASGLIERLLRRDDEGLRGLSGAWWPQGVIVGGSSQQLPWVDGVEYLAACDDAPDLYVPTTHDVTPHAELVVAALRNRFAAHRRFALLDKPRQVLPLTSLEPIDRGRLVDAMVAMQGSEPS